jgi:hypothetical protein
MDPGSGTRYQDTIIKFTLIEFCYNLYVNTVSGKREQFSKRIGWARYIQGFQHRNEMSMNSDISDQRGKICTHKTS